MKNGRDEPAETPLAPVTNDVAHKHVVQVYFPEESVESADKSVKK